MATYLLRPQDGGKDIAIPFGKTTIGRGPFLGVRNTTTMIVLPADYDIVTFRLCEF